MTFLEIFSYNVPATLVKRLLTDELVKLEFGTAAHVLNVTDALKFRKFEIAAWIRKFRRLCSDENQSAFTGEMLTAECVKHF